MNGITISERNFNSVASRLIKFFNGADIINWHSFDCGMKRHIPTDFILDPAQKTRARCVYRYPCVSAQVGELNGRKFIRVSFNQDCGYCFEIGDVIKFCGNRLQTRTKFLGRDFKWCYDTYQLWDANGGFKYVHPEREWSINTLDYI